MTDERIRTYANALAAMSRGHFDVQVPAERGDALDGLGRSILELSKVLERRFREIVTLSQVTGQINAGIVLEEVLDHVYESFRPIIPYDRIGFSVISDDGLSVRATWARSEAPVRRIQTGYTAPLKGSSLQRIVETGDPRILNDLVQYLAEHPGSDSTRLIVTEGMRSSLTCPLIAMGRPIGFMFFSCMEPQAYEDVHVELFQQIAGQLAVIVEKSRLYQQLLALNEVKNRFLGIAAHDLRNPLAVFQGTLGLLLEGLLGEISPEQREYLERMNSSSRFMLSLINDLLDVSAIESGRLDLEKSSVDVRAFLEEMVSTEQLLAKAKSMALVLEPVPALPLVHFDRARISQVLNNLIANAIKFSHPGSTIRVRAGRQGDAVWIAVADEGQGIPPDEVGHIFKEFERTSVRPTGGEKSTGLGLAIVKRLVEAHGGRVWVESTFGVGSTFTFLLPARPPSQGS